MRSPRIQDIVVVCTQIGGDLGGKVRKPFNIPAVHFREVELRGKRMTFRAEGEAEDIDEGAGPELLLELLVRAANAGTCGPCGGGPAAEGEYCAGSYRDGTYWEVGRWCE